MDKEWWEPIVREDGHNDWLCDHLGDAQEKMDALWAEITKLRSTRPEEVSAWSPVTLRLEQLEALLDPLSAKHEEVRTRLRQKVSIYKESRRPQKDKS